MRQISLWWSRFHRGFSLVPAVNTPDPGVQLSAAGSGGTEAGWGSPRNGLESLFFLMPLISSLGCSSRKDSMLLMLPLSLQTAELVKMYILKCIEKLKKKNLRPTFIPVRFSGYILDTNLKHIITNQLFYLTVWDRRDHRSWSNVYGLIQRLKFTHFCVVLTSMGTNRQNNHAGKKRAR